MRHLVLTSFAILIAGPALASSIETVTTPAIDNTSVVTLDCAHCPPLKPKEAAAVYTVPELAPGTQRTELIEIDGERKILRTEAWMGGSPVVFVSKGDGWASGPDGLAIAVGEEGVDLKSTTAAVDGASPASLGAMAEAEVSAAQAPVPPDLGTFQLRLN